MGMTCKKGHSGMNCGACKILWTVFSEAGSDPHEGKGGSCPPTPNQTHPSCSVPKF